MKIRNGFVSNSSSSSFIVKTDKTKDEVYKDIFDVCQEYIRHSEFLRNTKNDIDREKYTLENIKESVKVTKTDTDGIDGFVKTWYIEDYNLADKDFKGTTVIYGNDNFLPADTIDDFIWARHLYNNNEYEYVAGCGHMG